MLLPTFGNPTRAHLLVASVPDLAIVLSMLSLFSKLGALRLLLRNLVFPFPPRPPATANHFAPDEESQQVHCPRNP